MVPPLSLPLLLPLELCERSRNVGDEEEEAHELRLVDGVIPKISCTVGRWYSVGMDSVSKTNSILCRGGDADCTCDGFMGFSLLLCGSVIQWIDRAGLCNFGNCVLCEEGIVMDWYSGLQEGRVEKETKK
jgi:hypothetical protein